ncbi:MAG: S8 family serine peptidase, partial [Myxococcota bacterium]
MFNDGADPTRVDPIAMGGISPGVTIPGIMISSVDGDALASSTDTLVGRLSPAIQEARPNRIATFSSRGPNGFTPDVLKPDLVAPGVQILSAGSPLGGIFDGGLFSVISGTSFSSPHMAGLFALLKERNPDWSPAAARSAFMTSGRQNILETFREDAATPFDLGGGMVVPSRALNTGLVYEADIVDYSGYACGQGIVFDAETCAVVEQAGAPTEPSQLNYPSITASSVVGEKVITRTVTNVSPRFRIWKAKVDAPPGFSVEVSPRFLFLRKGESKTYTMTIRADEDTPVGEWRFGSLTWFSGFGRGNAPVRSPISVRKERFVAPAELDLEGVTGDAEFDVFFGYNGEYTAQVHGLNDGGLTAATVEDDPTDTFAFFGPGTAIAFLADLPENTAYARWQLFDQYTTGTNDDVDLYLFYCPDFDCQQIASSGNSGSNEMVEVLFPTSDPAIDDPYLVFAHGFNTDGGLPSDLLLFDYNFGVVDDAGNLTVVEAPDSASFGDSESVRVEWTGLNEGIGFRQLGAISHSDESGIQALT